MNSLWDDGDGKGVRLIMNFPESNAYDLHNIYQVDEHIRMMLEPLFHSACHTFVESFPSLYHTKKCGPKKVFIVENSGG